MSRMAVFFLMVVAPALSICLALLGLETLRSNLLGWFLLVFGIAYPVGGVIDYFIHREPFWKSVGGRKTVQEEKGDRSLWLILPGFLVVFFAPPLEWLYLQTSFPKLPGIQIAGLVLLLLGLGIHSWSRTQIRGLYSGHVEIQEEHRLVQSGPYQYVRHPGYTGFVFLALGLAVGYSSWIGLAAIPVFLIPGLMYRMRVEERMLMRQFGKAYQEYRRRTKALFPGIW